MLAATAGINPAQARDLDAEMRARIDQFIERERQASRIPGIALAIVQDGRPVHVRGFGHDGRGNPITGDTPFPIGSLTKSFTALLMRQAIDAGRLEADAPVRRYLPWFRVADEAASQRITLRHLVNQTSGFSLADGLAPLMEWSGAGIEETARGLSSIQLNRPVGERFEYSNLNWVVLGAVLEAATGRSWQAQIREQVFRPLRMTDSHIDLESGRQAGMTAPHRLWFGWPVTHRIEMRPGLAPAGGLVSSANDLSRYLAMMLANGEGPSGRVVSAQGVAQLLSPATPPRRLAFGETEVDFRYGEGWVVGPFGAAADARWHQGALASFEAWMVLLPETRQAVALLINTKSELPFNGANAVTSRLPLGVVNLLRGEPPPRGPSLSDAYRPFNIACGLVLLGVGGLSVWAGRSRRKVWSMMLFGMALAMAIVLPIMGFGAAMLSTFVPDLALVVGAALLLMCLPAAWRTGTWLRRTLAVGRHAPPK